MERKPLGRTGLTVPKLCLGTMTWGFQNTADEAYEQMDYALDQGIDFFDTAEMYAVPPTAETYGTTETIIGDWFERTGKRDKILLATKMIGRAPHFTWVRDGKSVCDAENVAAAIDASLRRLKTDYIDLFQIHWPDRSANRFGQLGYDATAEDPADAAPLEDTLAALKTQVDAGKIRFVGLSNDTPWGVMRCLALAEAQGLPRVQTVQNPYSLLNRTYEISLAEISMREDCGLLAYAPLAAGQLSGKYRGGALPEGARRTIDPRPWRYRGTRNDDATDAYLKIAADHGLDPCQMAIAFVADQPFVTSAIIGATSMDQLKVDIAAHEMSLSDDVMAAIENVHQANPNPGP